MADDVARKSVVNLALWSFSLLGEALAELSPEVMKCLRGVLNLQLAPGFFEVEKHERFLGRRP